MLGQMKVHWAQQQGKGPNDDIGGLITMQTAQGGKEDVNGPRTMHQAQQQPEQPNEDENGPRMT